MTPTRVRHRSVVDAPTEAVWRHATDFDGISHELMPFLRMRPPRAYADASIETVPLGVPLGRAWLLLFGVLPVEFDHLTLTEVIPGASFQERSSMLSMRRWEHRRELRSLPGGSTEVTDTVLFEPRGKLPARAFASVVRALFAHRHRRLAGRVGGSSQH